jgi:hypothetical protein
VPVRKNLFFSGEIEEGAQLRTVLLPQIVQRSHPARFRLLFHRHPLPFGDDVSERHSFLLVKHASVRRYGCAWMEFPRMNSADLSPPNDVPRRRSALHRKHPPFNTPAFGRSIIHE